MTVAAKGKPAVAQAGPVVFVSDAPVEQDGLSNRPHEKAAKAITAGLVGTEAPLTVGVFGAWGSGKTSLMKMIQRLLDERCQQNEIPEILPVFFEAWRYEHEPVPLIPLLKTIECTLRGKYGKDESYWAIFEKAAYALAHTVKIKAPWLELDLKEGLKQDKTRTAQIQQLQDVYYNLVESLESFVRDKKLRLVVLIDDLDRCGETALDVLESTKTVFHIPGVSFVIGLDTRPIGAWLQKKYGADTSITPELYLEKMISVPFHLPAADSLARSEMIAEICRQAPALAAQLVYPPCGAEATLRRIKRILNEASLILRLAGKQDDAALLVGLVALREVNPGLFAKVHKLDFAGFKSEILPVYDKRINIANYNGFWLNFKHLTSASAEESYNRWMQFLPLVCDTTEEEEK